jgi:hypothetical protein
MLLNINKTKLEKLTDMCYSALLLLEHKNIVSFSLYDNENITVQEAKQLVNEIFQDLCLESDD